MATSTWGTGTIIAERYRLLQVLGQGGMGSVWRAEHVKLRSPVAIKVLNETIASHPEMLERFLREAQSAAALRGSYVVQIFDYGVEGGNPYIAMELLVGESLAARLERGALDAPELAWIFSHITRAVDKAHEQGITHRDLKPDNIFLAREADEEIAKVLDFGIAKVADSHNGLSQSSGNTRTGSVLGTPHYMSPEQARGNKMVDWRSDLWALGVIAYECLTARVPFDSTGLGDLVLKICTTEPCPPSRLARVPAGFDAWFGRAVDKTPEHRFQSARAMNESLQKILAGPLAEVQPETATDAGLGEPRPVHAPGAQSGKEATTHAAGVPRHALDELVTGETQLPAQVGHLGAPGPQSGPGHTLRKTTGHGASLEVDVTPESLPKRSPGRGIAVVAATALVLIGLFVGLWLRSGTDESIHPEKIIAVGSSPLPSSSTARALPEEPTVDDATTIESAARGNRAAPPHTEPPPASTPTAPVASAPATPVVSQRPPRRKRPPPAARAQPAASPKPRTAKPSPGTASSDDDLFSDRK
jgi:eukaryotic-like serine/threonine-protein kinase